MCRALRAGPTGSTGFCDGQCCNGTCSFDYASAKYFCCESPGSKLQRRRRTHILQTPYAPQSGGTYWSALLVDVLPLAW